MAKTRRHHNQWKGWKKEQPSHKERTTMLSRCGQRCFLGKKKSFPICTKNTCSINKKGVYSAYIRARRKDIVLLSVLKSYYHLYNNYIK